jgi:predicted nucleic acid-binding protein
MSDLLVDASVAVKWLIPEEHTEQAVLLLRGARVSRSRFICPPHFTSEVFNVVYRRMQRGDPSVRLTADQATA